MSAVSPAGAAASQQAAVEAALVLLERMGLSPADLVAADPGQTIIAYSAEPGSAAHQALGILASWAATNQTGQLLDTTPPRTDTRPDSPAASPDLPVLLNFLPCCGPPCARAPRPSLPPPWPGWRRSHDRERPGNEASWLSWPNRRCCSRLTSLARSRSRSTAR